MTIAALAGAIVAVVAIPSAALSAGGPVILGGDDLTDHGSVDGSGNLVDGWLYIQKALAELSGNVTRPNDGKVAALGSDSTSGGAGEAVGLAAAKVGLGVTYVDGPAAINDFFAALGAGTAQPRIIWLAGDDASNDMDPDEIAAVAANASRIDAFVSSGGGLMSHGGEGMYTWLGSLIPGLKAVGNADGPEDLQLTPAGLAAFPGLTNADINTGPWHNYFEGNFGGLAALVRSPSVKDSQGNDAAVIIGGRQVTLTAADLAVTKVGSPARIAIGNTVTYTMVVTNNGPTAATGTVLTDTVPAGLTTVSATSSQGSCAGGPVITCSLGTLASGAKVTVTVVARGAIAGTVTNRATVAAAVADPNEANNAAEAATTVVSGPRLTITKTGPATGRPGARANYRITVRNRGGASASAVAVRDLLPRGMSLAAAPSKAVVRRGIVTWRLGTIAPAKSRSVTIAVVLGSDGPRRRCNRATAVARNLRIVRAVKCTNVAGRRPSTPPPVVG